MKKLLSIILAAALCAMLLVGCTNGGDTGKETTEKQTDSVAEDTKSSEATKENSDQETKADKKFSEHADLVLLFINPMPLSDDAMTRLSKALSAITEEKFNASVKIISTTYQDYQNKMNMMLATGDQVDIFQPLNFLQTFADQGYLLDMTPYEEYYREAAEAVGEYMKVGQIDGHQYCIPNAAQGIDGGDSWIFNKKVVEELELEPMLQEAKLLADLEPVFQKIKENTEYVPLIGTTEDAVVRSQGDAINGKTYIGINSFCYVDPAEPDVVKGVQYRETYKQMAELAYKWAGMGLTSYDEIGNATDLFRAERSAAYYYGYSPVVQYEAADATGMEVVVWRAQLENIWNPGNSMGGYCVSSYTEYPEQALAVLNDFFINPDFANILEWGIEGEDYVVVDEEKGLVGFPEGVNMGNVGFYNYVKGTVPNQFICYESSDREGYHTLQQNFSQNEVNVSPYIGFVFDATPVSNEISACTNVVEKYQSGLMNGLLDPEEYYPQYIKELEANGVQNIIDETQKQLDKWLEANK